MSGAIQISVKPFGFPQAESALRRLMLKTADLHIPFTAAGRYLVARAHAHFREERSPQGTPWKALSAAYVAAPKPHGRGGASHPIRYITGKSEASVTYEADARELAVGSNLRFPGGASAFRIHELGGATGRGATMPARPSLGINDEDARRVTDLFVEYFGAL